MRRRQRLDQIHKHPIYTTVEKVLLELHSGGHQAVLAGGAVRDALLGTQPKDFDIATSALPDEVEGLFSSTLAVGKAFGTIVVIEDGHNFEVTTFRSEGEYLDGRRPSTVEFSGMEEDAKRRDFTVNAFFYDPVAQVLFDFHAGLKDLECKIIRTVGTPDERFKEDRLRMLRAVRFVGQLGFAIEDSAMSAIRRLHEDLKCVSSERILNEMQRLLGSTYLKNGLSALLESQLYRVCWPEIERLNLERIHSFSSFTSWENAFSAVQVLVGEDLESRLRSWKASKESLKRVKAQSGGLKVLLDPKSSRADRILALGGAEFADILVLASGLLSSPEARRRLDQWVQEYLEVAGRAGELPKPFLNGEDLLKAGVPASEKMGRILKALYQKQLEGEIKNREQALEALRKGDGFAV